MHTCIHADMQTCRHACIHSIHSIHKDRYSSNWHTLTLNITKYITLKSTTKYIIVVLPICIYIYITPYLTILISFYITNVIFIYIYITISHYSAMYTCIHHYFTTTTFASLVTAIRILIYITQNTTYHYKSLYAYRCTTTCMYIMLYHIALCSYMALYITIHVYMYIKAYVCI